eukprot:jgi/Botrbrau1/14073/Bobra.182_3s0020.1
MRTAVQDGMANPDDFDPMAFAVWDGKVGLLKPIPSHVVRDGVTGAPEPGPTVTHGSFKVPQSSASALASKLQSLVGGQLRPASPSVRGAGMNTYRKNSIMSGDQCTAELEKSPRTHARHHDQCKEKSPLFHGVEGAHAKACQGEVSKLGIRGCARAEPPHRLPQTAPSVPGGPRQAGGLALVAAPHKCARGAQGSAAPASETSPRRASPNNGGGHQQALEGLRELDELEARMATLLGLVNEHLAALPDEVGVPEQGDPGGPPSGSPMRAAEPHAIRGAFVGAVHGAVQCSGSWGFPPVGPGPSGAPPHGEPSSAVSPAVGSPGVGSRKQSITPTRAIPAGSALPVHIQQGPPGTTPHVVAPPAGNGVATDVQQSHPGSTQLAGALPGQLLPASQMRQDDAAGSICLAPHQGPGWARSCAEMECTAVPARGACGTTCKRSDTEEAARAEARDRVWSNAGRESDVCWMGSSLRMRGDLVDITTELAGSQSNTLNAGKASKHSLKAEAEEIRSKRMEAMVDRVLASRNRYLQYKYGKNVQEVVQAVAPQSTGACPDFGPDRS